ncbi:hypothetical protein [uncultured Xanthomonas sp.]|uniref:hypothetical protein n=1 Tax=uncultured Xanthomonas sp. TaxID=152831 RepID=UPI0025CDFE6F|nr:hypothetical protein [uncultured Xanthomonas sp.]
MKHTPTHGGAWRVVNGELIDESVQSAELIEQRAARVYAHTDLRTGGPDEAVPPIEEPNPPASAGRKTKSKE